MTPPQRRTTGQSIAPSGNEQRAELTEPATAAARWLLLICRCPNKNSRHWCHKIAELAAAALGEPTDRDRDLVRIVR